MSNSQLNIDKRVIIGGVIATIPLVLMLLQQRKKPPKKITTEDNEHEFPPFNSQDFHDTVKAFSSKDGMRIILKLQEEVGDIFRMAQKEEKRMLVFTGNLPLIQEVLKDKTSMKSPGNAGLFHDFGDDLLHSEGTFWKHSRKALQPAFSSTHIKHVTEVVSKHMNTLTKRLDMYDEKGLSFDANKELHPIMCYISLDTMSQYELSSDEYEMIMTATEIVLAELSKANIPNRWKYGVFNSQVREARAHGRKLLHLGYKIIESYRKLESPSHDTIIHHIVNNKSYKNDRERASDVITLFYAGFGTTKYTVTHTLKLLTKYPQYQNQLRAELKAISKEERVKSNLLHCIIKESMRLHPVSSRGSSRITSRDIVVQKDEKSGEDETVMIPKGSLVFCASMLLHHNPKYFKDVSEFKPERWVNPSKEESQSFIGFGLGKRGCLGQNLAKQQMYNIISRLIVDYEFTFENEGNDAFAVLHVPTDLHLFAKKII